MRITASVRRLVAYTPGEQPKAKNVVKLNTNENPYPPSPKCAAVLSGFDLDKLRRYPDPNFIELRKAIAKRNHCAIENVFVGNGSDEILALSAKAFVENDEKIGSLDPSYSLYQTLADIRDVPWCGLGRAATPWPPHDKRLSLFLWTNPNAPTGEFAEPETIRRFAAKFPGVVLVDEAYADFARANCMKLATDAKNKNILVMRTFSKSFSLAGLRVGYCVGPADLIEALYKVKDSYNVDAIAQAVALAAFKDYAWMKANARKVIRTRKAFTKELTKRGWDVLPSESNFVFAKPPEKPVDAESLRVGATDDAESLRVGAPDDAERLRVHEAARLFEALRARNIFVRYFPKSPLTRERLRITIGTDDQMTTLLKAIDEMGEWANHRI